MGHSILFKQCGSDHMTRGRSHAIDRIVIHHKATLASARNNAIYSLAQRAAGVVGPLLRGRHHRRDLPERGRGRHRLARR